MSAITAQDLTKSYDGKTNALEGLAFNIAEGETYGLLGRQGSGKRTVVKLLAGLFRPSRGRCSVMGVEPSKRPEVVHRMCGIMLPSAKMYASMTGQENLHFFGRAAGMSGDDVLSRSIELMKDLGIWEARDALAGTYSTSMQQRLSLARALLHRPKVLLLDEPDSGLDPEGTNAVLALLQGLAKQEGITVLLCTHRPRVAQRVCKRFGILRDGKLLADGNLPALCQMAGCAPRARFHLPVGDTLPGWTDKGKGYWEKTLRDVEEMPRLLHDAVEAGHAIYEARLLRPSVEDAYVRLLGKEADA